MMRTTWRTPLVVFIGFLQIQALKGIKTTNVTATEGQVFDIRCEYSTGQEKNAKYFQGVNSNNEFNDNKILTNKHDEWERKGRFSVYDNTTGAFFVVRVEKLYLNDSGSYWCGVKVSSLPDHISVIQLKVLKVIEIPAFTNNHTIHKFTQQLLLVALLCVAAMIFVCLFTIFLQLAVKQRSAPRKKRETSDYETMMPGVKSEPEHCCLCSHPDCTDLSALPRPPADLCSNSSPKPRESFISFSYGDYVDVDVPGHVCQYQHLDVSQMDENVYHSLHGNNCPKQISHS